MDEMLTQEQIDALFEAMNSSDGEAVSLTISSSENLVICIHCRKIIKMGYRDPKGDTHRVDYYTTSHGCRRSQHGHTYVSKEWLNKKKNNYGVAGWIKG